MSIKEENINNDYGYHKSYSIINYLPDKNDYPTHIALIPDGGRRWALDNNCTNKEAYIYSMKKIKDFINLAFSSGAKYFSVYFASTYNFNRKSSEIKDFCDVEWDFLKHDFFSFAIENRVKIRIVGVKDDNMFPYLNDIEEIEQKTRTGERTVYFCFNYNSFQEIESAMLRSLEKKDFFVNHLDIVCPVNLLIRTGGANVLSGFLLPQLANARLYFSEKLFNDYTTEDFEKCINEYMRSELKYGV